MLVNISRNSAAKPTRSLRWIISTVLLTTGFVVIAAFLLYSNCLPISCAPGLFKGYSLMTDHQSNMQHSSSKDSSLSATGAIGDLGGKHIPQGEEGSASRLVRYDHETMATEPSATPSELGEYSSIVRRPNMGASSAGSRREAAPSERNQNRNELHRQAYRRGSDSESQTSSQTQTAIQTQSTGQSPNPPKNLSIEFDPFDLASGKYPTDEKDGTTLVTVFPKNSSDLVAINTISEFLNQSSLFPYVKGLRRPNGGISAWMVNAYVKGIAQIHTISAVRNIMPQLLPLNETRRSYIPDVVDPPDFDANAGTDSPGRRSVPDADEELAHHNDRLSKRSNLIFDDFSRMDLSIRPIPSTSDVCREPGHGAAYAFAYDESAGNGITVYVVDSGLYMQHRQVVAYERDIGPVEWIWPTSTVLKQKTDPYQPNGHGTGIWGRVHSNSQGTAKRASSVFVQVRTFVEIQTSGPLQGRRYHQVDIDSLVSGLRQVVDRVQATGTMGKAVVTISIGLTSQSLNDWRLYNDLHDVFQDLWATKTLVVTTAGNQPEWLTAPCSPYDAYPGKFRQFWDNIMIVGGIDLYKGARAPGSCAPNAQDGSVVHVYAAWQTIVMATQSVNHWLQVDGTSLAAPTAAGVAAYVMGRQSNTVHNPSDVIQQMINLAWVRPVTDPMSCFDPNVKTVYNGIWQEHPNDPRRPPPLAPVYKRQAANATCVAPAAGSSGYGVDSSATDLMQRSGRRFRGSHPMMNVAA